MGSVNQFFIFMILLFSSTATLGIQSNDKSIPSMRKEMTNETDHVFANFKIAQNLTAQITQLPDPFIAPLFEAKFDGSSGISGYIQLIGVTLRGHSSLKLVQEESNADSGRFTVKGSASIPSLLAEVLSCDIDLETSMPDGSKHTLTALGDLLKVGVNNFKTSALIQGSYDENSIIVTSLVLEIEVNFIGNGTGEITVDGEKTSLAEMGSSLNKLFNSIWNSTNKPLIQNYLKCVMNTSLKKCTPANLANCEVDFADVTDPDCVAELRSSGSNAISSAGSLAKIIVIALCLFFLW